LILITGTGRCGTGWAAKVLTSAGVECAHEGFFNPGKWNNAVDELVASDMPANASWLVAPFLGELGATQIVHLVRHPKPTIDSFRRIGFFNPRMWRVHKPYSQFVKKHLPEAWEYTTTKMRAGSFYVGWNRMIEERAPDAIFHRVEDGPVALLEKLGIEWEGELFEETDYNHREGPVVSDLDTRKLWDPVKSDLAQMMDEYGYEYIPPKRG